MSDYRTNEVAKNWSGAVGHKQLLKNNESRGTVRTLKFSFDTGTAAGDAAAVAGVPNVVPMASGDRVLIGYLPAFARVIGVQATWGAMGTGATLSIGTDATTYATTQPDFGAGSGTELISALSVAAASSGTQWLTMAQPTLVAAVWPDSTGVSAGYAFENKTGKVSLWATAGGANFASGKHVEGTIFFVADTE